MAVKILNITSDPIQRHTIKFGESEVVLILRYLAMPMRWSFNVEYKNFKRSGLLFSLGTLHMVSANQPFDFIIEDTSGKDIEPSLLDDFSTNRIILYMLEPADMTNVRGGAKVQV